MKSNSEVTTMSNTRTSQTKAIRLGAWTHDGGIFDCYKAEWGNDWQCYDRAHEPPQVQITISDGVDTETVVALLTDMLQSVRGFMEAEAEAEAREKAYQQRLARLTEDNVIQFVPKRMHPRSDRLLGLCPMCGRNDGYANIGKDHWAVCHEDSNKWLVGRNLFSSWMYEDESVWERNRSMLDNYHTVEPVDEWPAA